MDDPMKRSTDYAPSRVERTLAILAWIAAATAVAHVLLGRAG